MPRPPLAREHIESVIRAIAAGRRQRDVAKDVGKSKSHVQTCLQRARLEVAEHTNDLSWLRTSDHTAVEVAQAWLEAFAQA